MPQRPRSTAQKADKGDTTVYPTEEKLGEDLLQCRIVELLRPLIERYLAERGILALTGADQFIYFRKGDTRYRVAPDVYVLPGVRPERLIRSWKVWEERIVPSFALEVVSLDVDKDYILNPPLYQELGVRELVIFDPDFESEPARFRFQVFRQVGKRGLHRTVVSNEDRVLCRELGCHLRVVGAGEEMRLRLGTGPDGDVLFASEAEAERAEKERERAEKERERAEKERERAEKERERAEKEQQRAARLASDVEVARLRAQIELLQKRAKRR